MTTFSDVLAHQLRREPGRPLITFYDDATGERVELSVTTYANWVAKTASLLVEEHDLERGQVLCIDLPTHWLGPVFLGAAWSVGLRVVGPQEPGTLDAVVCGPETLEHWASSAGSIPVLACALRPLGVRFAEALPPDVHDVGVDVWSQPDAFTAWDPPTPADAAYAVDGAVTTQEELWKTAAAGSLLTDGGRLFSESNPASPPGISSFAEPLARGGSLVLVTHPEPGRLETTYVAERATARFP